MICELVNNFESGIYNMLAGSWDVMACADKIYIGIARDRKLPFIAISFLDIENISNGSADVWRVEFEIDGFTRTSARATLMKMMGSAAKLIELQNFDIKNTSVTGVRLQKAGFKQSKDLFALRFGIKYSAIIKPAL